MEETKKSSKGLIMLIIVLIICVIGLGGYIVYDKVLNKNKQITSTNNNTTPSTKKEENINLDNSDKNRTLETYISQNIDLESSYEVLNNEEYETLVKKYEDNANNIIENENEVAINNTISTEINWKEVSKYVDNNSLISRMTENSKLKSVKYDDLLNTKKQLYGENSILEKQNFSYGNCSEYIYIEKLNIYIENNEGCGLNTSEEPIIKKIIKQNNILYVFVNTYNYTDFESPIYSQDVVMEFRKQSSGYYLYKLTKLN